MGSFYGSGGIVNYNQLTNKPITQLTGTESEPIILNTLNYGEYLIDGYFVYTSLDTVLKGSNLHPTYISIMMDDRTLRKAAHYETFESEVYFLYHVYFKNDETCVLDKITINKTHGLIFLDESEFPQPGVEGVLYISKENIYQWNDDEEQYIQLNSPKWGSIGN